MRYCRHLASIVRKLNFYILISLKLKGRLETNLVGMFIGKKVCFDDWKNTKETKRPESVKNGVQCSMVLIFLCNNMAKEPKLIGILIG